MPFKKLTFQKVMDSSENNLLDDFFIPVLKEAVKYDRGVGYFTSGWLSAASRGIIPLVEKGGSIRLLTSPILQKEDYEAIILGNDAKQDEVIFTALSRGVDQLAKDLDQNTRIALAWMIADKILDIKIAIPKNKLEGGDFHVKFGVIQDSYDEKIAFMGSYNDSLHANVNFEELTIFRSSNESDKIVVDQKQKLFDRLWDDKDANIKVYSIPEVIKNRLVMMKEGTNRPYKNIGKKADYQKPTKPADKDPWAFQKKGIHEWVANGRRGILEMATGTGKTKTSLFAISQLSEELDSLVLVISCPSISLVNQWSRECSKFNISPIVASSEKPSWKKELADKVSKLNLGMEKYFTIVCTHESLKSDDLKLRLNNIDRSMTKLALIADECHHLGTLDAMDNAYRGFDYSLGLSATPERYYDGAGTEFIKQYLGPVLYRFTIKDAIREKILCPYEYHAHIVDLDGEEIEEYRLISKKIGRQIQASEDVSKAIEASPSLQRLFLQRSNIIKKARMKIETLRKIFVNRDKKLEYAIVFCAPHTDELELVAEMLKNNNIVSHRFTGEEDAGERDKVLDAFTQGEYQVITAMNVFNEGIDVPITREAYILSSSTNPTEYVQRRGRVLRRSDDSKKEIAFIHDFIVVPPMDDQNDLKDLDKKIIQKELKRFYLFAEDAINNLSAISEIGKTIDRHFN